MSTGIDVLDTSVQEANQWLKAIELRLGVPGNRRLAYNALRATLHAVRDRIGVDNAAHLAAQLPLLLKGVFYENWQPSQTPTRERTRQAFLEKVEAATFRGLGVPAEQAIQAVLEVMSDQVEPSIMMKLAQLFPAELRYLWPLAIEGDA